MSKVGRYHEVTFGNSSDTKNEIFVNFAFCPKLKLELRKEVCWVFLSQIFVRQFLTPAQHWKLSFQYWTEGKITREYLCVICVPSMMDVFPSSIVLLSMLREAMEDKVVEKKNTNYFIENDSIDDMQSHKSSLYPALVAAFRRKTTKYHFC